MTALDRLPDYVLCMQGNIALIFFLALNGINLLIIIFFFAEYALPLMQKVFELGVNSNVNTIPYINKSITLLNTQKGLS